jgi:aspartate/glutamate racemase
VHTVGALIPTFVTLIHDHLPANVRVFNAVDDSLLSCTREEGAVSPRTRRRLASYVWSMQDAGADVILVTCSSMGAAVEDLRPFVDVPLLRVDEPMVREAVAVGQRIGVLATLATTLSPTVDLVQRKARDSGRTLEVHHAVCDGAFDALSVGDVKVHDAIVAEKLLEMASEVDVILLAQASMARVVDGLSAAPDIPILSSPRLAIEAAGDLLPRP